MPTLYPLPELPRDYPRRDSKSGIVFGKRYVEQSPIGRKFHYIFYKDHVEIETLLEGTPGEGGDYAFERDGIPTSFPMKSKKQLPECGENELAFLSRNTTFEPMNPYHTKAILGSISVRPTRITTIPEGEWLFFPKEQIVAAAIAQPSQWYRKFNAVPVEYTTGRVRFAFYGEGKLYDFAVEDGGRRMFMRDEANIEFQLVIQE